jgi:hypothetical protein
MNLFSMRMLLLMSVFTLTGSYWMGACKVLFFVPSGGTASTREKNSNHQANWALALWSSCCIVYLKRIPSDQMLNVVLMSVIHPPEAIQ